LEVDTSGTVADTERAADALAARLAAIATAPPLRVHVTPSRALGSIVRGPGTGPRGLTPAAVLADIVDAGGPEMERLARPPPPPPPGPWYRAAALAGAGPEALAPPIVLWVLAR